MARHDNLRVDHIGVAILRVLAAAACTPVIEPTATELSAADVSMDTSTSTMRDDPSVVPPKVIAFTMAATVLPAASAYTTVKERNSMCGAIVTKFCGADEVECNVTRLTVSRSRPTTVTLVFMVSLPLYVPGATQTVSPV